MYANTPENMVKILNNIYPMRTSVGSKLKYSAIPPQTPAIIFSLSERYNLFGSSMMLAPFYSLFKTKILKKDIHSTNLDIITNFVKTHAFSHSEKQN